MMTDYPKADFGEPAEFVMRTCERCTELQERLAAAEDALQALYDYQNGCPLPTYRTGWTAAMVAAENVLRDADEQKEVLG